ncbi:MAG: YHYH protein [Sediminibacterium sp.]|nr:YHYH protein [Sediminibacterium sp.]
MMIGIRSWQQQVPLPQMYSGNNSWSIPLQPELSNEPISTRNNFYRGAIALAINGVPVFNALNNRGEDAYLAGELDQWGGHCGRADDYHYHIIPEHLSSTDQILPIAFALDGFAIYGNKEPDGAAVFALDSCNGHFDAAHIYHYHATHHYPYSVGAFRGKVQIDPKTSAPENQIIPQAFARPVRPPGKPLRGAFISKFETTGPTEFTVTYQLNNQATTIRYYWNSQSVIFINQNQHGILDSISYPIRKF